MISLNEVYFGKNQNLTKAEKVLGEFRAKYMGHYYNADASRDKLLRDYESIMADEFGFEKFFIDMSYSEIANAGTLPIGRSLDVLPQFRLKNNLILDSTGYRFDKKAKYYFYMTIYSGLLFNEKFTDEEAQAIIMHEVGHNFYNVGTTWGYYTTDALMIINLITAILLNILSGSLSGIVKSITLLIMTTNASKKLIYTIDDYINKNDVLFTLSKILAVYDGIVTDLEINVRTVMGWFLGAITLPNRLFANLIGSICNPTGYANEKFADNFATMYGYGPALVSALQKLDFMGGNVTVNRIKMSNSFTRTLDYFLIAPIEILSGLFDEHPIFVERARDQKRYLERELSKQNVNPEVKKILIKNSNDLNKSIDKFIDVRNRLDDQQIEDFRRIYQVLIDKSFNGDFRHNIDIPSKNLKQDIDSRYGKLKLI